MFINGFENKLGTFFSLLYYKYIANNSYNNSNSKKTFPNNFGFCINFLFTNDLP